MLCSDEGRTVLVGSVLEEQIYKSELSSALAWVLCEQLHRHTYTALLRNGKLDLAVLALLLQWRI